MGPGCRNDVVEAVIKGNDLCNRYGIDTMGVGGSASFAIECYEKGIIDEEDTGGLELTWGNPEALVALIEQICSRRASEPFWPTGPSTPPRGSAEAASSTR